MQLDQQTKALFDYFFFGFAPRRLHCLGHQSVIYQYVDLHGAILLQRESLRKHCRVYTKSIDNNKERARLNNNQPGSTLSRGRREGGRRRQRQVQNTKGGVVQLHLFTAVECYLGRSKGKFNTAFVHTRVTKM